MTKRSFRFSSTQVLLFALLLYFLLFVSGCRLGYVLHVAVGQFKLIQNSIPVTQALEGHVLSPEQKDRLHLVADIKAFGEVRLGLMKTENYQTIYMKSPRDPIYFVSACPKDKLIPMTWWFPVIGDVPYLGFFDLKKAKEEKSKLIKKDLDVLLGTADAYSTLGWFQDPVTLNLLEGSLLELTEIIIHEMTHTTFYVKGQGAFNEGLASLVGKVGAFEFLKETYGSTHPQTVEARQLIEDERIFASYLNTLLKRLNRLYGSSLGYEEKLRKRDKIFSNAIKDFEMIKPKLQTDRFSQFSDMTLNNASIISIALYHQHFNLFERIFNKNESSVNETLRFFKELAEKEGDLLTLSREWLKE